MSNQEEKAPAHLGSTKWEKIKRDLEELEKLYIKLKQGANQSSFEYELIIKAEESGIGVEQYRKIFEEYYTEALVQSNCCAKNLT